MDSVIGFFYILINIIVGAALTFTYIVFGVIIALLVLVVIFAKDTKDES